MNNTQRPRATAIIADDEPLLRMHLNRLLAELWPELAIVHLASDGHDALTAIQTHQPDVVFLDIHMPNATGLEIANQLDAQQTTDKVVPMVVFITAYDAYAVSAFEHNAVDYLLKPVSEKRLEQTCKKLQHRLQNTSRETLEQAYNHDEITSLLQQIRAVSAPRPPTYLTWLKVQKKEDIHIISVSDVRYFQADNKYVSVYVQADSLQKASVQAAKINQPVTLVEYLLRRSLRELIGQLDPAVFCQIHRSTIVNMAAIERVTRDLNGGMQVCIDGQRLPISRAMQKYFKA